MEVDRVAKVVKHEELEGYIVHLYHRWMGDDLAPVLHVWGPPGIGKSWTVRSACKTITDELDLEFSYHPRDYQGIEGKFVLNDMRASQLDPVDLRGTPKVEEGMTKWYPPAWLPRKGQGILFFDELNLSPPSVQKACYELILDRRLGEYILPDGWMIIAAGNRITDRAFVHEMSSALKNRFAHLELAVPTIEDWIEWAIINNIDGRVITFLKWKPSLLFSFDPTRTRCAYPTPRSWHFCSSLIKGVSEENVDFLETLIASTVGEGASIEFVSFLRLKARLPKFKDILDGKVKPPEDIDLLHALVGFTAERYRAEKTAEMLKKILELSLKIPSEFAILLLKMVRRMDRKFFDKVVPKMDAWKKGVRKWIIYLQ